VGQQWLLPLLSARASLNQSVYSRCWGKRTGLRDEQAGDRYDEKITGMNRLVVLVMVLAIPLAWVTSAGEEKPTVLVTDKHRQLVYRHLPALIKCGVVCSVMIFMYFFRKIYKSMTVL